MRMQLLATGALGALALALAGPSAAAPPTACDRACLQGMVDKYLAAVVAHDAHRLPLAKDVRYTENGQALALNDGFWGTATAAGTYKHYFLDTRAQQAGFYGVMKENGQNNVILALRLKLRGRQISEIETVLGRSGLGTAGPNGAANLEAMGKPDDVWLQPAAPDSNREDVVRVSNMYSPACRTTTARGSIPSPTTATGLRTAFRPLRGRIPCRRRRPRFPRRQARPARRARPVRGPA